MVAISRALVIAGMLAACWSGLPDKETTFVYVRPSPVPDTCVGMRKLAEQRPTLIDVTAAVSGCSDKSHDDEVWCRMQVYYGELWHAYRFIDRMSQVCSEGWMP